jgi:DNA-binding transcriptional MerR regulator
MRGIGDLARESGLTTSALRFYDRAGVLVPAAVDPNTGYRWYSDDQLRAARLIAALRRVGMPITDIAAAVRALPDPATVRPLLDRHLLRLEDGLADARRELSRAHALLDQETTMTRVTLPAAAFAATIDAVRFAINPDENPSKTLTGILFETGGDSLTLVATDRFRLAVATTPATVDGPPTRVVVPPHLLDGTPGDPVTLTLESNRVLIGDREGKPIPGDFPDHRRLVRTAEGPQVTVDVARLRAAVESAPEIWREHDGRTYPLVILAVQNDGMLGVVAEPVDGHVAVNRDFLLQALDAGGAGQLVLELDGPIHPLAIRTAEHDRFSLLMPVRH